MWNTYEVPYFLVLFPGSELPPITNFVLPNASVLGKGQFEHADTGSNCPVPTISHSPTNTYIPHRKMNAFIGNLGLMLRENSPMSLIYTVRVLYHAFGGSMELWGGPEPGSGSRRSPVLSWADSSITTLSWGGSFQKPLPALDHMLVGLIQSQKP